jgi:hypothetical protein
MIETSVSLFSRPRRAKRDTASDDAVAIIEEAFLVCARSQRSTFNNQDQRVAEQCGARYCDVAEVLSHDGRAIEAAHAWVAWGVVLEEQWQLQAAADAYETALSLKPDCLKALLHLGKVRAGLDQPFDALACFDKALALDVEHARIRTEFARVCLSLGDFDRGWDESQGFAGPLATQARSFEQAVWDGTAEALTGKTILAWADQELGDSVHWLRYVPLLRDLGASRLIVECQSRLVPLVRRMVRIDAEVDLVIAAGAPPPAFDVHVPLTQLPVLHRAWRWPIPRRMPLFSATSRIIDLWRPRRTNDKRVVVGLSWSGHPEGINAHARFAPLAAFAPLVAANDIARFISLQMGPQTSELLNPPPGLHVEHLQDDSCSMADTAGLMHNLDLIITVDTLVAHLAGALGKPVWLVLPHAADWRWLRETEESPLYPTMKLFRQRAAGDWEELFQRVASCLSGLSGPASL